MSIVQDILHQGIYVIHALKGYELHEKRIIELFKKNNLQFEFVTDGDPVHFTDDILAKYFVDTIKDILPEGVLSCTLNHIFAYERMVQKGSKYAIIFENDPFFLGNFTKKLERMADEIDKLEKGFIISLENSTLRFPAYWQTKRGKHLYKAVSGRMAGAYLIDLECAVRMLEDLKTNKCRNVIDWWHNNLSERGILKIYWAHPPLVEQGSHNGYLNSTISSKPNMMSRRITWVVQRNFRILFKRLFKDRHILP